MNKLYIKNFFGHLSTVLKHKYYVGKYCWKSGLYWRGLVHDLSKFNPVEFFESVRYYDGRISPINKCKKERGHSMAWFHHRGRNKHHYEYWIDNFETGMTCAPMPYRYALEMLCDYLGAGRAYGGKKFTFKGEYEWWVTKKRDVAKMHPNTKNYIDKCLRSLQLLEEHHPNDIEDFWRNKVYKIIWKLTNEHGKI